MLRDSLKVEFAVDYKMPFKSQTTEKGGFLHFLKPSYIYIIVSIKSL